MSSSPEASNDGVFSRTPPPTSGEYVRLASLRDAPTRDTVVRWLKEQRGSTHASLTQSYTEIMLLSQEIRDKAASTSANRHPSQLVVCTQRADITLTDARPPTPVKTQLAMADCDARNLHLMSLEVV